jgi:hypothetical protein
VPARVSVAHNQAMSRRLGIAANALGLICIGIALLMGGDGDVKGAYFNATVKEPFSPFDSQHQSVWLIGALVLIVVGTGLLLRRD